MARMVITAAPGGRPGALCITLSVVTMGVRGADTLGNSVRDTFLYLSWVPMVSAIYLYRVIYTELKEGRNRARPSPPCAQRGFFGGDEGPKNETGQRNALVLFPVPAAAGNTPSVLRIRRSPVLFVSLSRRLRRVSFFERQRKRQKKPLKGTYSEAVPLRIPPRRPRGLRPPLDPPGAAKGGR